VPRTRRRGAAVWALAFLCFLAALNVFNAALKLTLQGINSTIEFSLFGSVILSNINIEVYFWVSIILTLVIFGVTVLVIYRGFPVDPEVLERLAKLEEKATLNANMLENTQMGFFRRFEENEKTTDDAVRKISLNLEEATKQSNENLAAVKKHMMELTEIRKGVEKMEKELAPTKPKLASRSKTSSLKGVKPRLTKEMQAMGITNIGEFLTTDPVIIAQKSRETPETITNLQAMAQLMMVPGIDENDAELLVKVGVRSHRELANQDPVQLCKAVVGIVKAYVEQKKMSANRVPTVEDVSSWIRLAKL